MATKQRALWKCPKCGERFVTAKMWHSCGRYSVKDLFAQSEPKVQRIFRKLAGMARACGPSRMIPQKTRLVFMKRVRFAAIYPRRANLEIGIELPQRSPHPRFHKIETYTRHMHGHYLRIENEEQLDAQVQEWLRESYLVGAQESSRLSENRAGETGQPRKPARRAGPRPRRQRGR